MVIHRSLGVASLVALMAAHRQAAEDAAADAERLTPRSWYDETIPDPLVQAWQDQLRRLD